MDPRTCTGQTQRSDPERYGEDTEDTEEETTSQDEDNE